MDKVTKLVARKNAWKRKTVYGFTTTDDRRQASADQLTYTDLWLGFKGRTTAHGVSPIADARGTKTIIHIHIYIYISANSYLG